MIWMQVLGAVSAMIDSRRSQQRSTLLSNGSMAKEETLELEGKVLEVLPNTMFRIQLDGVERPVIGYISGRMRKHDIKILLGDRVLIEFSPYDLTRGRITRRR
jgi:translation initiation factor IF-1